jgi:hypothetical protein
MTEFGTRFHICRYRKFFLISDLSSPDESPYRKTLMFKFSAHSDVSVINGDRFIFQSFNSYYIEYRDSGILVTIEIFF